MAVLFWSIFVLRAAVWNCFKQHIGVTRGKGQEQTPPLRWALNEIHLLGTPNYRQASTYLICLKALIFAGKTKMLTR